MNEIDKRKLNMLLHLAKVDGRFEKSERKLLHEFIEEKGLLASTLDEEEQPMKFGEMSDKVDAKIELLYWAIKLIQADQIIHEKELIFCKNLASKLHFKEEIVTNYVYKPLPDFSVFEREVMSFWIMGL